MKQFLAPEEVKSSWWIYLGSILFTVLGIFTIGTTVVIQIVSSRVKGKDTIDQEEIASVFSNNELLVTNLLPFVIGFLLLAFCARVFHARKFISFITARPRFDFKRFLVAFAIWGAVMGVSFALELNSAKTISWNYNAEPFLMLFLITIVIVPIQTGFEEIFLRGFVLQLFGRAARRGFLAILGSATIFGIMHLNNPEMFHLGWPAFVFYAASGIMTALITVLDDGIELSWGFHTANNFFGILILTNDWQAFQTDALFYDSAKPNPGMELLFTPFVIYPIFIAILWRMYKWKNWKEKLFSPIEITFKEPNNEQQLD